MWNWCRAALIATAFSPISYYLPDDFDLVVQDANLITGLLTANWNAPALWRRHDSAPIA